MNGNTRSVPEKALSVIIIPLMIVLFGMAAFMTQTEISNASALSKSKPAGGEYGVIYTRNTLGKTEVIRKINSAEDVDAAMEYCKSYKAGKSTFVIKLNKDWTSQHFFTNEKNNNVEINLNGNKWEITGSDILKIGKETSEADIPLDIKSYIPKKLTIKGGEMSFTGETAKAESPIYTVNCIVDISDVRFSRCKTVNKGIIYYGRAGELSTCWYFMDNVEFTNCECTGEGAAVYFDADDVSYSDGLIERNYFNNCRFTNCRSNKGGAFLFDERGSDILFRNCEFSNCCALDQEDSVGNGGAIGLYDTDSTLTFKGCRITECMAENAGGAVFLAGSDVTMILDNTTISNCSTVKESYSSGSAVFVDGDNAVLKGVRDKNGEITAEITECRTGDDGAVYSGGTNFYMSDISFSGNSSNKDGGAVSITSLSSNNTIENCCFENNLAKYRGGAIFTSKKTRINGCVFRNDSAENTDSKSNEINISNRSNETTVTKSRFYSTKDKNTLCNIDIWDIDLGNSYNASEKDIETYLAENEDGTLYKKNISDEATILLDAEMKTLGKEETDTWYFVDSDLKISHDFRIEGNVNIIVKDDCTLAIKGDVLLPETSRLAVYAQSYGEEAGKVTVKGTTERKAAVRGAGTLKMISGNLEVSAGTGCRAIGSKVNVKIKKANYAIKAGKSKSKAKKIKIGYKAMKYASFKLK